MSLSSFFRLSSPLRAPLAASLKTLCSWPNSGHFSSSPPLSAPPPSSLSFSSSSPSPIIEPEWWETLQHKDYEWLRSPVAQTGQFLRLPYLGPGSQPKGIMEADFCTRESDQSQYLPFFYSSTRQELHQRLLGFRDSWKSGSKAHIAPAGPQGVGKSLYSYMICCFAAVHGFPLLYIPLAGQWCDRSAHMMCHILLTRFLRMNNHLKMEDPITDQIRSITAIAPSAMNKEQKQIIDDLAQELLIKFDQGFVGMDQKIPRFIVVDEHNELFRPSRDGTIPANEPQLKPFARWGLGGVAVMCGSSHSKFFALMPGGTKHTILELPPLSKEDAVAFLTDPESPAFIAGLTTAQAERLFGDLGGVPRILTAVKEQITTLMAAFQEQNPEESQSAILNQAVEALLDRKEQTALMPHIDMKDRFIRFVDSLNDSHKQQFVEAAEHCLLFGHFPRPTWSQPILDHGLIFTKGPQAYPVNQYASTLLMDAYLSFVQKKRLSSIDDEAERGHELERQIFAGLRSEGSRLVYQPLVKQKPEEDEVKISIGDHRYQGFDGKNFSQLQPLPRLPNGEVPYGTWLFRPLEKTFPRVDFVIVSHGINCKKVIAIQSTVSEPNVHAAGSQSDWKGFFGVAAAAGQNSSAVTWTQLCKQLAINIDQWFCDYIYITTSEEPKGIADDKLAQLPAGTSIGVMKRKHLSSLKIVY